MDYKEVKIIFKDRQAEVEFKGIWTRRYIDIAYKNMLLQLPRYMATLREKIIIPETFIEEGKEAS